MNRIARRAVWTSLALLLVLTAAFVANLLVAFGRAPAGDLAAVLAATLVVVVVTAGVTVRTLRERE